MRRKPWESGGIRPAPEGRKIAPHGNLFACSGRFFRHFGARTIPVLTYGLRHGLLSFTPPGLVEKAGFAGFDVPLAQRVGARERAFLVAEEFALDQVLRDSVVVDGDERAGRNLWLFRYSAEYRSSCRSSPLKTCRLDRDYAGSRIRDFTGYFAKPLSKVTSVAPFTAAYAAR